MSARREYTRIANDYARRVVAGKIVACRWVRLACERHLNDLKRKGADWPYAYRSELAERACKFVELMPYTKGKWARVSKGQVGANTIRMSDWQVFITCAVFGWAMKTKASDGRYLRRFTLAEIFVPRKNGKSEWVAAVGLFMLAADGEQGAEVYCGATTEKQAWEVFRPAKAMVDRTVRFRTNFGVETSAESIFMRRNGSRFQPLIGDPGDGASPSCSITDEYHEHKTDDQFDTMRTGMAAREQPLAIVITTAGSDMAGPCYSLQQEIEKILEGTVVDERVFGIVYTIDKGDDWTSDAAVRKANPNYGVSITPEYIEGLRDEAMRSPRKQTAYKTKHLNIWVHARDPWLMMEQWDACCDASLTDEQFEGEFGWASLDLSSKLDLSSLVWLFRRVIDNRDHYYVFSRHYAPEARVQLPELTQYQEWAHNGYLVATDGNSIDQELISQDVQDLARRFSLEAIGYDSWGATKLASELTTKGLPMVEVPQTVLHLSEPMKELEALIVDGRLHHDGHPVLRWMMSNVTAKSDAKDNVFPRKERKENKIDGAVALITAMGRALASEGPTRSIYEDQGLTVIGAR